MKRESRAICAVGSPASAAVTQRDRDSIPANWDQPQRRRPDHQVLSEAGFEMAGRCEFTVEYRWSLPEMAGWIRSTSFLPAPVLADQGATFDADLAGTLGPFADDGTVHQAVGFACELARRAAAA
jgi:hypothetical protein